MKSRFLGLNKGSASTGAGGLIVSVMTAISPKWQALIRKCRRHRIACRWSSPSWNYSVMTGPAKRITDVTQVLPAEIIAQPAPGKVAR
jgi:hypothetical protein